MTFNQHQFLFILFAVLIGCSVCCGVVSFAQLSIPPTNEYSLNKIKERRTVSAQNANIKTSKTKTVENMIPTKKETEGTVNIAISANTSNSIFLRRKISYSVTIENTYKEAQQGTVVLKVFTDKNKGLFNIINTVNVKRRSSKTITNKFTVPEPGFYELVTYVNLSDYEDTIRNVFGYKPDKIMTPMYFPKDFETFWRKAKQELQTIEPNYKTYFDSAKSTKTHKVYLVEMMSLEHTKISAWLTIPRVGGFYPVLLGLPGYNKLLLPRYNEEYISLQLNIRKNKSAGEEVDESEFEYLLYNINDPKKYIYRGAYMDCIRALDFISSHYQWGLDTSRIVLDGASQGATLALVTAALDSRVRACLADNPVYCDTRTQVEIASKYKPQTGWPLSWYKQYIYKKRNQVPLKNILATMDYFDPQNFMPYIKCPILVSMGLLDKLAAPSCIYSAFNKLDKRVKKRSELYIFNSLEHEVTYHHHMFKYVWTLEKFVANRQTTW